MGTGQGPPDTHRTQHARPAAPGMRPKRLACHCAAPPVPQTVLPLPRGSPAAAACTDPSSRLCREVLPHHLATNRAFGRFVVCLARPQRKSSPQPVVPTPAVWIRGHRRLPSMNPGPRHPVMACWTNNCGRRKGARARGCGAEGASGPALTAGNNRCLQRRPLRWPRMAVSTQMSATSSSAPLGCRTLWC